MKNLSFNSFSELVYFLKPLEHLLNLTNNENYISTKTQVENGILPSRYAGVFKEKYEALYVLHEFSHFLEFSMSKQIRRIKDGNFNFHYKTKVRVLGQYYDEPKTCQGFEREIRTLAIQFFILNHYRKELNLTYFNVIHLLYESIDAICRFISDAFIFKYDVNKMALNIKDFNYDETLFKKQVFKRVLLEMSVLNIESIIKHKNKVKKYINKNLHTS